MTAAAIKLLLLLLAVWQVSAQGDPTCNNYIPHPGIMISGLTNYVVRSFCECQLACSYTTNCNAFVWYSGRCLHRYGYIKNDAMPHPDSTLYVKFCYPSITPPPYITIPPTFPPGFGGTPPHFTRPSLCVPAITRPISTTNTRPTPPTQPVFPPFFTTTSSPCPPAKGLSTGLVILIAVFTAIGGIILGMLLAVKCCPIGKVGGWFGSSHPSSCACTTCSPTCKSCHVMPHHPHVLHVTPGPAIPSGNMHGGQTYAVAANALNGTYCVNIGHTY